METPIAIRQLLQVPLGDKLTVLRFLDEGRSAQEAAETFNLDENSVTQISDCRRDLEGVVTATSRRRNPTIGDKLKVLHFIDKEHSLKQTAEKYGISKWTARRIVNACTTLVEMDNSGSPIGVRRPLKGRIPDVECAVTEFVGFVRSQCLHITLNIIQERDRLSAEQQGITSFKASRGWVHRFIWRSGIHLSVNLNGKGGSPLPADHTERMIRIREITKEYQLRNIYNEDESGLLFRMGHNRTYLSQDEVRSDVRRTDFQKYKQRITTVFCINADESHKIPMRYIGKEVKPVLFRDKPYAPEFYSH